MTSYVSQMKAHLAAYKTTTLGVQEDGVWASNGRSYTHLLPTPLKHLNLLSSVHQIFDLHESRYAWKLHRDFHHLTSSQALAFNLFLPGVADLPGVRAYYSSILGLTPREITKMTLEEVDNEDGTNFDAVADLEDGSRSFIEVKFTETGFGTAEPDARHCKKLTEIYWPRLDGRVGAACFEEKHFFANYQLYRNLSALRRGHLDVLVLLLPRSNAALWSYAIEWSTHERLRELRESIRVVALEDILDGLKDIESSSIDFSSYVDGLNKKYRLPEARQFAAARSRGAGLLDERPTDKLLLRSS